ncbi:MAG: hypothetical protein V2A53_00030 [bacterium]
MKRLTLGIVSGILVLGIGMSALATDDNAIIMDGRKKKPTTAGTASTKQSKIKPMLFTPQSTKRDINGTPTKGFDSEIANAKFLWKFNNPSVVWDAMYKPTQAVPHTGYNLQDMINELRARGYDLDYLLDELGLRPILGTATNTLNPTFYFDLNDIFSGVASIQLDISNDYNFGTMIYSKRLPGSFSTSSPQKYTLKEINLKHGLYFWRIKVLNNDLPNLYSDVGMFGEGEGD